MWKNIDPKNEKNVSIESCVNNRGHNFYLTDSLSFLQIWGMPQLGNEHGDQWCLISAIRSGLIE